MSKKAKKKRGILLFDEGEKDFIAVRGMTRPKKSKVGWKNFDIKFVPTSHELEPGHSALCKFMEQEIIVADNLSPEKQANTLFHVILHAICNEYNIFTDDDAEERAIICLANGISLFMKDNPETLEWIVKNLNQGEEK